jgi:hypothetical protein
MTSRSRQLSRRQILAGVGTVGLVTAGAGLGRGLRGDPPYTHYTYAQEQDGGPDLLVAWYETRDGEAVSPPDSSSADLQPTNASFEAAAANDAFVDELGLVLDERGPVVDVANALPGDSGTLVVGLTVADDPGAVWFRPRVPSVLPDGTPNFTENGRTEPEVKAGDESDDRGELQDALELTVWYDTGVLNSGVGGACNGEPDPGEQVLASGTLTEVVDRLAGGVRLQTGLFGSCLESDRPRCLGVRWAIPGGAGNEIQSDAVGLDLQFVATACEPEPTNPFGGAT